MIVSISQIENLQKNIEPLRQEIIHHEVYSSIKTLDHLRIFMKYHVYAVWDFMSLLKSLQRNLTCVDIPWYPIGNADTRYLINEIVCGEESDLDSNGERKSHFEMYLDAMNQAGADANNIQLFIHSLQNNDDFGNAFNNAGTPASAQDFVNFTFGIINTNEAFLQAAIFTFGREDLIPGMFISMVKEIAAEFPDDVSKFLYYLERHIEVDGGHHSHLALEMTSQLCGNDDALWTKAEEATIKSLKRRLALWDGVLSEIRN